MSRGIADMGQTALYRLRFADEGHHRLVHGASIPRSPRSLAIGLGSWHFSRFRVPRASWCWGAGAGDQRARVARALAWAAGGAAAASLNPRLWTSSGRIRVQALTASELSKPDAHLIRRFVWITTSDIPVREGCQHHLPGPLECQALVGRGWGDVARGVASSARPAGPIPGRKPSSLSR